MAYPTWQDGKKSAINKLFGDDFDAGKFSLTFKTKAANGLEIKVDGSQVSSGAVEGELETKYTFKNGLTVKDVWNTKNLLKTELSVKNLGVQGSAAKLTTKFMPNKGFESVQAQAEFGREHFSVDGDFDGKTINAKTVMAFGDFIAGASVGLTSAMALKSNTIGLTYNGGDLTAGTYIDDFNTVRCQLLQKVNSDVMVGIKFGWKQQQSGAATSLELGTSYKFDDSTTVKAKIDNKLAVGLACAAKIKPGVTFRVSAALDASNLSNPNHKLGFGLELEH